MAARSWFPVHRRFFIMLKTPYYIFDLSLSAGSNITTDDEVIWMHKGKVIATNNIPSEIVSEKEHTVITVDALQQLRIAEARSVVAGRYTCLVNDVVSSNFEVIVRAKEILTEGLKLITLLVNLKQKQYTHFVTQNKLIFSKISRWWLSAAVLRIAWSWFLWRNFEIAQRNSPWIVINPTRGRMNRRAILKKNKQMF